MLSLPIVGQQYTMPDTHGAWEFTYRGVSKTVQRAPGILDQCYQLITPTGALAVWAWLDELEPVVSDLFSGPAATVPPAPQGATCLRCAEYYPYAAPSPGWACWACVNHHGWDVARLRRHTVA